MALSFCNEYRNLSDDKFTILEQHSNGNSIIYVASEDKCETNGQYPEGLMKIQKRQDFLKVINSGVCPDDRILTDEEGCRWVQCEFCGKFAKASAFASYGGFGKLNKGKCYECSRNPNINTVVNVSEEKARQKLRYDPDICPECGGRLRLIQGPFGKFMGCENYPTCKFKRRVRKK